MFKLLGVPKSGTWGNAEIWFAWWLGMVDGLLSALKADLGYILSLMELEAGIVAR
jgi:hypothetical protein